MPRRKIPPDAFDFYFALGPARSYQTVADEYGVTKRAVTKLATKERWQDQIATLERKARENSDERKLDALQVAHEQRLKALRMVLGKGIEGLRQMTIDRGRQRRSGSRRPDALPPGPGPRSRRCPLRSSPAGWYVERSSEVGQNTRETTPAGSAT